MDARGRLWGTREHGQQYVLLFAAGITDLPRALGVRYVPMSLKQACDLLPHGALMDIQTDGGQRNPVRCLPGLAEPPALLELARAGASLHVRKLDSVRAEEGRAIELAERLGCDCVLAYDDVATAVVMLARAATPDAMDFQRICDESGVRLPVQLWRWEELPKVVRRRLSKLEER
jgi:hypothetical protein